MYIYYIAFGFCTDPCTFEECPKGSVCKVFELTGEAFCDPSCGIDNGGCDDDQLCVLALPVCANPPVQPCVGFVTCVDKGIPYLYVSCMSIYTKHFAPSCTQW